MRLSDPNERMPAWQQLRRRIRATTPKRRTWLLAGAGACLASIAALCAGLLILYTVALLPSLPDLREQQPDLPQATIAYTADGAELARYFRENRTWQPLDGISPHVVHALVATEDRDFYRHFGVDLSRLISAVVQTILGNRQGGSTITMQLARNLYPEEIGNAPTVTRKLKEIVTAVKIERHYSKDEILEMYLNTVPFSFHSFGIEAAAQTYFDKPALQLTAPEAAVLVGMLKGTTFYNPVFHPARARERRNLVLRQMASFGYLEQEAYGRMRRQPIRLDLQPPLQDNGLAPYFAEYVRHRLEEWGEEQGYNIYTEGLRVYTTLDSRMQSAARAAANAQMPGLQAVAGYEWSRRGDVWLGSHPSRYKGAAQKPFSYFWETHQDLIDGYIRETARYRRLYHLSADSALHYLRADEAFMDSLLTARARLQLGFVAVNPANGYVKAWVGGRNFEQSPYDHIAVARRQPGSTFKPFVYAAAVSYGYSPRDVIRDSVRTYRLDAHSSWTPRNSGGSSGGLVTVRAGLTYSMNTVTAKLMSEVGPHAVAELAQQAGIDSRLNPVPSLALGTTEVTLLELVEAYGTLATLGRHRAPVVITHIETRGGRMLYRHEPSAQQVLSSYVAYPVVDMMRDVVDRGTGSDVRYEFGLDGDLAGKTGTTQNNRDGWFVLMHPQLVAGAWVGFDDPRLHFRSTYWGQGGHNAVRVVADFFGRLDTLLVNDIRFQTPPGYTPPEPFLTRGRLVGTARRAVRPARSPSAPYHVDADSLDYAYELTLDSTALEGYNRRAPQRFAIDSLRPAAEEEHNAEKTLRNNIDAKLDTTYHPQPTIHN